MVQQKPNYPAPPMTGTSMRKVLVWFGKGAAILGMILGIYVFGFHVGRESERAVFQEHQRTAAEEQIRRGALKMPTATSLAMPMATPADPYHFDVAGYHFDVSKVLGRYYLIVNHGEYSSPPCASLLEAIDKSEAYVKEHGER